MVDITMCTGEKCPIKTICYRYRAIPSKWAQSYFFNAPFKDGTCEYFEKIYDEQKIRKEEDICQTP